MAAIVAAVFLITSARVNAKSKTAPAVEELEQIPAD
jgi:hypothetical protein